MKNEEDTKGREAAKVILNKLGFKKILETDKNKNLPIDLVASNGKERYSIELKYREKPKDEPLGISRSTSGFPFPWIYRATFVLKDERLVQKGYKLLVLVISKQGDKVSHMFLEPRFEELWFNDESLGREKDLEDLVNKIDKWD